MNRPEFTDVQGMTRHGYGDLTEACYFLVRIRDARAARKWVAHSPVTDAVDRAPETALQLAFTVDGLRALGLIERIVSGFSVEFLGGMSDDANRSRRLGDVGWNAPENWDWGRPGEPVHAVVILLARGGLDAFVQRIQDELWHQAFDVLRGLDTSDLKGREPFGYVDGISQPKFDWDRELPQQKHTIDYTNTLALGELFFGYPNEYGKYTERPVIATSDDPADDLLPAEDHSTFKDLGVNGTFFVLRQLEQDVRGFWRYLDGQAKGDAEERMRLGACMVGRTLNGDPLAAPGTKNDFNYDDDLAGTKCPFGAHIRRANPRNADWEGHPSWFGRFMQTAQFTRTKLGDDLMASTRFHRILRRGREYGPKLSPEDALGPAPEDDPARGIHFGALGANIGRQFEFVQNAWLMSSKFNGLNEESDPLLGNREPLADRHTDDFSIQREGRFRRILSGVPRFVTVRGGAYFFLPSIRALRYLSRDPVA